MSPGRLPSAGSAGCGRPGCPADGPQRHALPQVRVFTFSVGQHNYDVTPLQWMACANKGERGWLLAGMGGCRAPGSPLTWGLALVLWCVPLPARCWLQPWRTGQPDSQTAGQAESRPSSCLCFSFPRLLLRNSLHRCHPHQHAGTAGCPPGSRRQSCPPGCPAWGCAQAAPAPLQRAQRLAASVAGSWGAKPSS